MKTFKLFILLFLLVIPVVSNAKKIRIVESAYYEGAVKGKEPQGKGLFICTLRTPLLGRLCNAMGPDNYGIALNMEGKYKDVIEGDFNGNLVSNAQVRFSSGWTFEGQLEYKAEKADLVPLKMLDSGMFDTHEEITYKLIEGTLYDADGDKVPIIWNEPIEIVRYVDGIHFTIGSFEMKIQCDENLNHLGNLDLASILGSGNTNVKFNANIKVSESNLRPDLWDVKPLLSLPLNYTFNSGATLSYRGENNYDIMLPNGDFFKDYDGGYSIRKTLEKGVLKTKLNNYNYEIEYPNGDQYQGTLKYEISMRTFMYSDTIPQKEIYYKDGTLTLANGNKVIYTDGKTEQERAEYQLAGNAFFKKLIGKWDMSLKRSDGEYIYFTLTIKNDKTLTLNFKITRSYVNTYTNTPAVQRISYEISGYFDGIGIRYGTSSIEFYQTNNTRIHTTTCKYLINGISVDKSDFLEGHAISYLKEYFLFTTVGLPNLAYWEMDSDNPRILTTPLSNQYVFYKKSK